MSDANTEYRGRFAPSPTGPLHFGSLLAALGSYLEAKYHQGEWHIRIEDLDPPRCEVGAASNILRTLDDYGFEWDGPTTYQSDHRERYEQALQHLSESGLTYPCYCSRKHIHARCPSGEYGPVYDGHCRHSEPQDKTASTRLVVEGTVQFRDAIQGRYQQNLSRDIGDYHLRRRDGLFAYHLGVVVDDAEQGFNHIVRGYDLLDSTPRQIYLQRCLGFAVPHYAHLPLALQSNGQKLSKQNLSPPLEANDAVKQLWLGLHFLGQSPPQGLRSATLFTLWQWALSHWKIERVPAVTGQLAPNA